MAAGYLELFINQGEDINIEIPFANLNGTNFDLTNYTITSDIRRSHYSTNVTASFICNTAPLEGVLTLSLPNTNTANLKLGRYVSDVFLFDNTSNTRMKLLDIVLYIDPSSTKL